VIPHGDPPSLTMNLPQLLHRWNLSPRAAIAVQRRLARRVIVGPPAVALRLVAGLDAAFSADDSLVLAAVVLWDVAEQAVIETHTAEQPLRFPYVPGLLSFREAPALLAALRQLQQRPDALMCDGQGLAHPRRFGLACHLGVLCDLPALGVAKSLLVGEHAALALARGASADLVHRAETVGLALRTREGVKPVFVSVGHRLDLPAAARLTLACATGFRLPEPTRRADRLVAAAKLKVTKVQAATAASRANGQL
jgi:deoxyribonuclease V